MSSNTQKKECKHEHIENNCTPDTCRDCGAILHIQAEMEICPHSKIPKECDSCRVYYEDSYPQEETVCECKKGACKHLNEALTGSPQKPSEGELERKWTQFVKEKKWITPDSPPQFIYDLLHSQKAEMVERILEKIKKIDEDERTWQGNARKLEKILQILKEERE